VHGRAKRLRVIASVLIQEGLRQQRLDHALGDGSQAPHFNVDVAISLVNMFLGANGSTAGCDREDVQAAFEWLISPYVERAVWLNEAKDAVVFCT
jgi:hypothetical protein